jgi:hypothetical protein
MSSVYESADLIIKLYDLRREETIRKAREWYRTQFHPTSAQDVVNTLRGEHSAYFRMVTSYWEMAASFVNHGAIDWQMFMDANGEERSTSSSSFTLIRKNCTPCLALMKIDLLPISNKL